MNSVNIAAISMYLHWSLNRATYHCFRVFALSDSTVHVYISTYACIFLTESIKDKKSSQTDGWPSSENVNILQMFISLSTSNLFLWPLYFHIVFQFFHNLWYFHMLWTHKLSATVVNHAVRTHCRVKPKFLEIQIVFLIYLYSLAQAGDDFDWTCQLPKEYKQ